MQAAALPELNRLIEIFVQVVVSPGDVEPAICAALPLGVRLGIHILVRLLSSKNATAMPATTAPRQRIAARTSN
jgi:hypothetical protein